MCSVISWRCFASGDGEDVAAGACGALETDSLLAASSQLASGGALNCSEPPFHRLENQDNNSCVHFLGLL